MIRIEESGMVFQFDDGEVFQIEKSNLQREVGSGIKTVEFIAYLKDNELDFVEAKSSSPKPTEDNIEKFDKFISEITNKFVHSFNLYLSSILNRNNNEEIHKKFLNIDYSKVKFKFILIIKGHKIEWLSPLNEALNRSLLHHNKIWKSSVILMNEHMAKHYKLVKEW